MSKSIWPRASSFRVDRSLAAHTAMGLVISGLLYIICMSGTLAVFEDELGWWERPNAPAVSMVTPEAAQNAAEAVIADDPDTTHLYLYLPRDNWQRFVIGGDEGLYSADADGNPVGAYETHWNTFLIELHYYLHLPHNIGMILVAVFGVMMLGMAISGFLAHPKIFRDAFRLKMKGQQRLGQADLHNRISVWTAPFHIIVAGTGAVIGLFVVVALILAQTSFEGDNRAFTEAIFGGEPAHNDAPAPLADVGTALSAMDNIAPDRLPFLVVVHDPATAGQHVEVMAEHFDRLIYSENYEFNAAGDFEGTAGYADGEVGKQIAYSTYRLHFGDFGGTPMKIAYFVLGVLMCVMVATGLNIYFLKQSEKGRPKPRLAAGWSAIVWGSPALLTMALPLALSGLSPAWLTSIFWLGLIGVTVVGVWHGDAAFAGRVIRKLTGGVMVVTGLSHGALFFDTLANPMILATELGLIAGGVALIVGPFWLNQTRAPVTSGVGQAAE